MRFSRPVLIALLLSICLHLMLFSDLPVWSGLSKPDEAIPANLHPLRARLTAHALRVAAPASPPAAAAHPKQVGQASVALPFKPIHHRHKMVAAASAPTSHAKASAEIAENDASQPVHHTDSVGEASAPRATAATGNEPAAKKAASSTVASLPISTVQQPAEQAQAFPSQAKLRYQLSYNGIPANGVMQWSQDGNRYHVTLYLSALIASVRYESSGHIGPNGLIPEHYQAWRGSKPRESATFDWSAEQISYGDGDQKQAPLEQGAQDVLSLAWQLAIRGGAEGHPNMQVTTGKKIYHYPIKISGEGNYQGDTALPVVVFRAESADAKTEFWLARNQFNLPVRIVRKDDDKTIKLDAIQIQLDGHTVWPLR